MSTQGYQNGLSDAQDWIVDKPEEDPELVKKWLAWNTIVDLDEIASVNAIPDHKAFLFSYLDGIADA